MRVCAGLTAEDFQRRGILLAELCTSPCSHLWPWYHVLAVPVHQRSVLCLWPVVCL